jgi:molybdate transport system substrate-binding protein
LPHAGVALVGPLPKEIQNYTVYAAGIGTGTQDGDAAKALIASKPPIGVGELQTLS